MLGNDPLSSAPLSALGGAAAFTRVTTVRATGTQNTAAQVAFPSATTTNGLITAATQVAPSIFGVNLSEGALQNDLSAITLDIYPSVLVTANTNDSVSVSASTFNAGVTVLSTGDAKPYVSSSVFNAQLTVIASAIDELSARPLWEVINDRQAISWQNISNAESAGWGTITNPQNTVWSSVKTQT